jgi:hypothetical protein
MLLDGAMNADAFLAYVEHVLVPELQPGDIRGGPEISGHGIEWIAA